MVIKNINNAHYPETSFWSGDLCGQAAFGKCYLNRLIFCDLFFSLLHIDWPDWSDEVFAGKKVLLHFFKHSISKYAIKHDFF
jgi:hypothetical protein